MNLLPVRTAVAVFLTFAFAYFFSALLRAITATLSPVLTVEFAMSARDLGLLAGGYFLGFAATQLPMGAWLDRHGPRNVVLSLLSLSVIGCIAFSAATGFSGLLAARVLCGAGVSACLMAPLTGYRRWFDATTQLRANSWMLMTGSLGMVASTLPVQWLMPQIGWRPLFWLLALMIVLAMGLIAWQVPRWSALESASAGTVDAGYAAVWRHPYFRSLVPIGFFSYGALIAMQTLWAGPWLTHVAGRTPEEAASGLFWINMSMLATFWVWGLVTPRLTRLGLLPAQLIAWGLPLSFVMLAALIVVGAQAPTVVLPLFALYCVGCSFVALALPAVGMAFPTATAGRALAAYNLVVFAGVFAVQWGIGLLIDGFESLGAPTVLAYQGAMAVLLACGVASWAYFLWARPDNQGI